MSAFSPSITPFSSEEENDGPNPMAMMMNKFLETRTVLIFGGVDQKLAERVTTQILYLDHVSNDPIRLMINSPGGHVESGDTIHDLINYIESPVAVVGTGWVASIATHIFLGVPKEQRFCLPNTRFLIHQPSGGAGRRNRQNARTHCPENRRGNRTVAGAGHEGYRPRLLDVHGRSQGLWHIGYSDRQGKRSQHLTIPAGQPIPARRNIDIISSPEPF
jgi:ATP-dependent Clp endopeptidase proteolytic subunit ClpP